MKSVAFIGNYMPRCCGIATFTQDLRNSVLAVHPKIGGDIVMVSDDPEGYSYPDEVKIVLSQYERPDYRRVASAINGLGVSCVSFQHEFGIYGGPDGEWIIDLLESIDAPVVTTCHTILKNPTVGQRRVLRDLSRASSHFVVMTQKGREFLREIYGVDDGRITIIPHGIPDAPGLPVERGATRRSLGWAGRSILLTFGLLSPNKGIEYAIRALPEVVRRHPETLYVVVGATHPNLVRERGEAYREELQELAETLGVAEHLQFVNRFVSREELVRLIYAADIYLTPYLSEAQITSGTLAIAFGMGKPVISTPYWHAAELLADGAGVLVPFQSSTGLADAALALLGDEVWRDQLSREGWRRGRMMTWSSVGSSYLDTFRRVASSTAVRRLPVVQLGGRLPPAQVERTALPDNPARPLVLSHLVRISGAHGVFQHSCFTDPDPAHGFCLDDNARALILLSGLSRRDDVRSREMKLLFSRCASSLVRGFNHRVGRFRNFMSADGDWLEEAGSEDCHGRVLWALGHLLAQPHRSSSHERLAGLFLQGLSCVDAFTSPRAWAFSLLGLHDYLETYPESEAPSVVQDLLAQRLLDHYRACAAPGWEWFENVVTYDNGKLPQALLATGRQTGRPELVRTGLASLEFLVRAQKAAGGHFRPIGCKGFWQRGKSPAQFDQQPLEAQAMVAACLEARRATGDWRWLVEARRIHAWFHGANDLGIAVADAATGGCYDGLHSNGVNLNQGAESTLAYLQATFDVNRHLRAARGVGEDTATQAQSAARACAVVPAA